MGLSHQAIVGMHPDVELVAVCDSSSYILDVLNKYSGIKTFTDYRKLLSDTSVDAIIIATPSKTHAWMVESALLKGIHVFCEKPFVLDPEDGERITLIAEERRLVTQVGYHYRFVGAFQEARRVVASGALGDLHNVYAEAYGPVVLRPKGGTWRTEKSEGGGCLYDYASHAIDLINSLVGPPEAVSGVVMNRIFSKDVEDEIYASLHFENGLSGRLAVNWSDESFRKMSTRVSIWGTRGRLVADRQECQVYLREPPTSLSEYSSGWTVRYTTDLTKEVWYYLRGEEYSAQIDYFIQSVRQSRTDGENNFKSALATDKVAKMILDAHLGNRNQGPSSTTPSKASTKSLWRGLIGG